MNTRILRPLGFFLFASLFVAGSTSADEASIKAGSRIVRSQPIESSLVQYAALGIPPVRNPQNLTPSPSASLASQEIRSATGLNGVLNSSG